MSKKQAVIAPEMAAAKSLKDKVPAKSTLLKPLRDYAEQDARTELGHYQTRLQFLTEIVMNYKHDLEALMQYPDLLRTAVAKELGVDLSKNRKLWPEGMAKEWDKISQSILIPVNRLWGGIGIDGTKKVLEVLSGKGTLQQKVALMPRISTKGRKAKAPQVQAPVAKPDTSPMPSGEEQKANVSGGLVTPAAPQPATFKAVLDGIEVVHNDFIPTLLLAVKRRLSATNVAEWQMVAREIAAQMDKYDGRTGDAVEKKAKASKKEAAEKIAEPEAKAA